MMKDGRDPPPPALPHSPSRPPGIIPMETANNGQVFTVNGERRFAPPFPTPPPPTPTGNSALANGGKRAKPPTARAVVAGPVGGGR